MKLDKFDQSVLQEIESSPGDYIGILKRIYGIPLVSEGNARKKVSILKDHLTYKIKLQDSERVIGEMEETIITSTGSITTKRMLELSEEEEKSIKKNPKLLLDKMGFDPLQWKIKSCKMRRNYWDVTIKNALKEGKKHTNHAFAIELTVEPIQKALTSDDVARIFESLSAPTLKTYKREKRSGELLEVPIMDLHLGKLSWEPESGDDYDLKIAEELYKKTVSDIFDKVYLYNLNIEKIVFPIGQDFFHFDTSKGTTVKGTVMDTDTRWPKMYEKGIELVLWAIENLRQIAPVDVIYVAANHDKMMSFFLTHHVNAYFRNCKDITVDTLVYPRKYVVYGKNLIGYSHGSEEGKRIEVLMQNECPEWSQTLWREWHLGHLHSEYSKEISGGGLIVRRVSSITSRDLWHTEHGYKAVRKAQAFVWNKTKGKVLTIDSNVTV